MWFEGRKQSTFNRIGTVANIEKFTELENRFPGVIPGRGIKITSLAGDIAAKVVATFSEEIFDQMLIKHHMIEKDFASGWNRQNALSIWYSLGFICLSRCSMTSTWSEALTEQIGIQVYDATLEKMWILCSMPDAIRNNVLHFMRNNVKSITASLYAIVDARTNAAWFSRYAERLKGNNPPWEIQGSGRSTGLEDLLEGHTFSTDVLLNDTIAWNFNNVSKGVLESVCGS